MPYRYHTVPPTPEGFRMPTVRFIFNVGSLLLETFPKHSFSFEWFWVIPCEIDQKKSTDAFRFRSNLACKLPLPAHTSKYTYSQNSECSCINLPASAFVNQLVANMYIIVTICICTICTICILLAATFLGEVRFFPKARPRPSPPIQRSFSIPMYIVW